MVISGIIFVNAYNSEIQQFVISQINKQIEVKVSIKSSELSVWSKFPYISLVLNDAVARSTDGFNAEDFPEQSTDTLFTASRIYLQFNLFDIIKKNYRIRKVHAVKGNVNIFIDTEGKNNYSIFRKTESEESKESALNIALDGVKLSDFSWKFINRAKKINSKGQITDVILKGKFSQNNFSLNSLTSVFIDHFTRESIEYANLVNLKTRIILDVRDTVFTISRGDLMINDLKLKTGGKIITGEKTILDLQLAGEKLDIKSLLSILPIDKEILKKYSPSGNVGILAKINGEISSTSVPSIKAAFKLRDGKVFLADRNSFINGIDLKGTFSNGTLRNASTSRLNLDEFSVSYGNNSLKGNLGLSNFKSPFISASLSGKIMAVDVSGILNMENLKLENGEILPDLKINIALSSFSDFSLERISSTGLSGKIEFKGISGRIPMSDVPLDQLDGALKLENGTWFPVFSMKMGKNKLSANLVVNYLWEYMVSGSGIPVIEGDIDGRYLNITDFFPKTNESDSLYFQLPDSIYLNLHCNIDSFRYGKFTAGRLETWFRYDPGLLSVYSLSMQTLKGSFSAQGLLRSEKDDNLLLKASGNLKNIDINQLFYVCNNFYQDFIVSDNLKGLVSGKIVYSGHISPQLDLITKGLVVESDFTIENGELINFEPITELSTYVELSELQHIKFSTLKDTILIHDEKVYIPQMDINNSAFNISVSGTHGFDDYFEYKIKLSLSELLAKKIRKPKKESDEFGVIEDDGAGRSNVYLSIIGTSDDFKVKYDKKEAIINLKTGLQEEKKNLKLILKEELGLFKKDSLNSKTNNTSKGNPVFKMDWDDENSLPIPDTTKKKKANKFDISWDDEDPN